jgi:hypothetical protein
MYVAERNLQSDELARAFERYAMPTQEAHARPLIFRDSALRTERKTRATLRSRGAREARRGTIPNPSFL